MPYEEGDPMPKRSGGAGPPAGLSWSWEMDSDALMAALAELSPSSSPSGGAERDAAGEEADAGWAAEDAWRDGAVDELEADELESGGGRGVPVGRVAERLAPGPDLAAWLAMAPAAGLGDGDLAAAAGSWRRVAAWAQARELAAVAQIAARAAARDADIGTGPDGRPARVPGSAVAEVALELTLSS